jgi:hypothetical protein
LIRLYVVVEGQTEEAFVKHILAPHLFAHDVLAVPKIVTTRRDRITGRILGRGGGHWTHWRKDIRRFFLDGSADARFSTLFDLYGLPDDFPRLAEHATCTDTLQRVALLEQAIADDLDDYRLVPYIQRHEFEALVLAGLDQLRSILDAQDLGGLDALSREVGGTAPEDVDDGAHTAPSKRLFRHIPSYQKTVHGPLVVDGVGLARLRAACPRLDGWIQRLEQLPGAAASGG